MAHFVKVEVSWVGRPVVSMRTSQNIFEDLWSSSSAEYDYLDNSKSSELANHENIFILFNEEQYEDLDLSSNDFEQSDKILFGLLDIRYS